MTITYKAIEFDTTGEAIQYADASGGMPILVSGPQVVSQADADLLEQAGVESAYLVDREMPDGERRIMTVRVN